ncbi:MAG TPA: 1,4-alpha-glucan branching protein GlgB [Myxococcota bacterium]|nr:1,4-alpha-glucan branching protein GlgB [Myxococcota bacterium]
MLAAGDIQGFHEGHHSRIFSFLGAHGLGQGTRFAVWAPNAREVMVKGDFSAWEGLSMAAADGIWSLSVPEARPGHHYKYAVLGSDDSWVDRADPMAFSQELPPGNSSRITASVHRWRDGRWMKRRAPDWRQRPISIYEIHLGSWRRHPDGRQYSYREIAEPLADYVRQMGFTHVEFLPVMEHPFYGSWGYQALGHFAPTARFGDPDGLRFLIDHLHQRGIAVLLDWVPAHFPKDDHGLYRFDGTALYEHPDPRRGEHPDWGTAVFDYGRPEVRSFLLSSARYWLEEFHADGLRVDAVASMLYLDYSREDWLPNEHGGRENLEAVSLLKELNEVLHRDFPEVLIVAEESTAWPGVSKPTYDGGLGFGLKWDMGWMNDTLSHLARDPIHRTHHHGELTFRSVYAHSESFVLALSHDEVVHGKGSLMGRVPGDRWQKLASCRLLFGWQFAQPGKKLLFMGMELAQLEEWSHDRELDWALLAQEDHAGVQRFVTDLNALYCRNGALHAGDLSTDGVCWSGLDDGRLSVVAMLRMGSDHRPVLVVANFTPIPREDYQVGVPEAGWWRELLNSDEASYGGSDVVNTRTRAVAEPWQDQPASLRLRVPPLGLTFLTPLRRRGRR